MTTASPGSRKAWATVAMRAWIPCPGTIRAGFTSIQAPTASRKSLNACSGYIQARSSSARTASRTPGNGPRRPSFQLSLTIVSSPYSAFSSSRLGPGLYGSRPTREPRTRSLQPVKGATSGWRPHLEEGRKVNDRRAVVGERAFDGAAQLVGGRRFRGDTEGARQARKVGLFEVDRGRGAE